VPVTQQIKAAHRNLQRIRDAPAHPRGEFVVIRLLRVLQLADVLQECIERYSLSERLRVWSADAIQSAESARARTILSLSPRWDMAAQACFVSTSAGVTNNGAPSVLSRLPDDEQFSTGRALHGFTAMVGHPIVPRGD
jgi:hypothetical protein